MLLVRFLLSDFEDCCCIVVVVMDFYCQTLKTAVA
jgi:hypothetical protein